MPALVTVLIADDQARFRVALRNLLVAAGYRVLEAADGLQALATCRQERPDVAVLDMVMPHLDGIGVCRALRSDPNVPYVPILFYSQRTGIADRVAALRAGGDDFVPKDVDDEELLARVEALARVRRLLDARRRAGEQSERGAAEPSPLPGPDAIEPALIRAFQRSVDASEPLSIAIASAGDLDRKHERRIEAALTVASRGDDLVCRSGDAEYTVLLPSTHFGGAMAAAERIWQALPPSGSFPGLAIGGACYPNPEVADAKDLLRFAHAALERAREEGTAYVCLYHHQAYVFRPGD